MNLSETQSISMPTMHNVFLRSGRILAGGMTVALRFDCNMMLVRVTVGVHVQAPAAA